MNDSINRPAKVSFKCPVCQGVNHWDITVAPYDLTKDKPEQAVGISRTVIECPDCAGAEYTIAVENHGNFVKSNLVDYPNVVIGLDEYQITKYEDFLNNYYPSDPRTTFKNAQIDMLVLVHETTPSVQKSATFSRMVFLQWMGMLEAYLADRIIGLALDDTAIQMKLISRAGLSEQKFGLSRILNDPDIVANAVKDHLQRVLYHDVEKVDSLYKAVFGKSIYTDVSRAYFIKKAEIRHHAVHRNGRDNNGHFVDITIEEALVFGNEVELLIGRCETYYAEYLDAKRSNGVEEVAFRSGSNRRG